MEGAGATERVRVQSPPVGQRRGEPSRSERPQPSQNSHMRRSPQEKEEKGGDERSAKGDARHHKIVARVCGSKEHLLLPPLVVVAVAFEIFAIEGLIIVQEFCHRTLYGAPTSWDLPSETHLRPESTWFSGVIRELRRAASSQTHESMFI